MRSKVTGMGARVYLYVPGHRRDRFAKAVASGTDAVVLDLEDAVPIASKDTAREDVRAFLADVDPGAVELWVRINDGERGRDDLAALAGHPTLAGVIVPKAHPATLAARHADAPAVALVALVESASALGQLPAIAGADGVGALAIGEVDLAADLGLGDEVPEAVLWALRTQVVVAAAAAGLAAPLGPVSRAIDDLEGFAAVVRQLRQAGFGAVQAIHPKQVPVVQAVFTPAPEERAAAERVVAQAAAADGGVFVDDDGKMIDEAVLRSARRLLAQP
jgi:citrate lyase subunit beta/citryl-CoA lyase